MVFHCRKLLVRYRPPRSFYHIDSRRPDYRLFILLNKLDALDRRVRPLVKLTRKVLYGKAPAALLHGKFFSIKEIHRRFRKNALASLLKRLVRNVLNIVPNQDAHRFYVADSKIAFDLMFKVFRLNGKIRFLFYEYSSYITHPFSSLLPRQFSRICRCVCVHCTIFIPAKKINFSSF